MSELRVQVRSETGLHAKPAAALARAAARQAAQVWIGRPREKPVDAASVLAVLSLGIRRGEEVVLSSHAHDADDTLRALAAVLTRNLDLAEDG